MWLRKHVTPGAAPGGYTWDSADHVVEVPEGLADDLLRIGGFEVVEAPAQSGQHDQSDGEGEDSGADDTAPNAASAEVVEAPVAKKRAARKSTSPAVAE